MGAYTARKSHLMIKKVRVLDFVLSRISNNPPSEINMIRKGRYTLVPNDLTWMFFSNLAFYVSE